jgi:hypothetical protein
MGWPLTTDLLLGDRMVVSVLAASEYFLGPHEAGRAELTRKTSLKPRGS